MRQTADTRPSLLIQLRDRSNGECWSSFVETYAPLVYGYVRKRGVQDADSADLTQEVLVAVAGAVHSFDYDRKHGSFRRWLFTVVHNHLSNFWRRAGTQVRSSGGTTALSLLHNQPDAGEDELKQWEDDYQKHLFHTAADQVRTDFKDASWQAFWRTAVKGEKPKEVATALDMTVPAVYMSKRRILIQIKQRIAFLEGTSS